MRRIIYFDNAATTQVDKEVVKRVSDVLAEAYGNPSSIHQVGRKAKSIIESARKNIAEKLNCLPVEIVYTSSGTEATNMILTSAVNCLSVKRLITSKIEHHATLHTVDFLFEKYGLKLEYVKVDEFGNVDYSHLEELLKENSLKTLVSLMHINNEIGNITNISLVSKLVKKYDALFHSDAVQSVGHIPLNLELLNLDFLSASAHKFHGPKGIGFAYISKRQKLKPLIYGGGQEKGMRAGTEPVSSIAGLETALCISLANLESERSYITNLKLYFIEQINLHFPIFEFNGLSGKMEGSSYRMVNVAFKGLSREKAMILLFHLDINNIACSPGSACQSGASQKSHVISELENELSKKEALMNIRFSFSKYNTEEEIDELMLVLQKFLKS